MPEDDYQWLPREDLLHFEEISSLVNTFIDVGVERVRITGGEPLLRRNLSTLVHMLAEKPGLTDIALTTNGILLADQIDGLAVAGLRRVTVSLDTLRADRFKALTRSDELERVHEGMRAAQQVFAGRFKIDTVVINGVNDDELSDLIEYGKQVGAEVRFIEYMDVGGATKWAPERVLSRQEIITRLSARYGQITPIEESSSAPADRYRLNDGTTFGIISSTTQPFCSECDRSRLTADGMWYLCLYATEGKDLRRVLRSGASNAEIASLIRSVWEQRRDRGAEERLTSGARSPLIPLDRLKRDPHLEMHTRGG